MSAPAVKGRHTRELAPIEHPIRTEKEYNAIVKEMDALLDGNPRRGSAEYDRLELLSVLVAAWEDENEPEPDLPSPQDVVKFMAEQKGVSPGELAEVLGGRSRLSDFMNRKRELSREQIKKLRQLLGVPADLLIAFSALFVLSFR